MAFLPYIVISVLSIIPLWMILPRAGLSSWWALAGILPFGVIVLLWVLAFRRWPSDDVASRF